MKVTPSLGLRTGPVLIYHWRNVRFWQGRGGYGVSFDMDIAVRNESFEKRVGLVWRSGTSSYDGKGESFSEWQRPPLSYAGPLMPGYERWTGHAYLGEHVSDFVEFAAFATMGETTHWDNNSNRNYRFGRKPYPSPGLGVASAGRVERVGCGNDVRFIGEARTWDFDRDGQVHVVFTADNWKTVRRLACDRESENVWTWDTELTHENSPVLFAVLYAFDGAEFWDNNEGQNHTAPLPNDRRIATDENAHPDVAGGFRSGDGQSGSAHAQATSALLADNCRTVEALANDLVRSWTEEFSSYFDANGKPIELDRPVKALVGQILALPSYEVPESRQLIVDYVRHMTRFEIEDFCEKKVLLLASESGVWASELSIPACMMLAAGYQVVIGTETGEGPHILSVSYDPDFIDAPLGVRVVSIEEAELARRFITPGTIEADLLSKERCRSLSSVVRPPLVGDYLKDQEATMREFKQGLLDVDEWARTFDAIVIAGGSGAVAGFAMNGSLHHLVLAFDRLGKPIVAQCNGVFALVQAIDPRTGNSILEGKLVTTHSKSHEYRRGGWGWARSSATGEEVWTLPGADGNPIVDSEPYVRNAAGVSGMLLSPPATAYAVAIDQNIITARTTPDGAPATAALIALLAGWEPHGACFAQDENGFRLVRRKSG